MVHESLDRFIEKAREAWGPLSSETAAAFKGLVEELARDPETAAWLAETFRESPGGAELYRDPERGFVLTAYTESAGQYRVPHDHGSGWVIYVVHAGVMEMGTYAAIVDQRGELRLVRRERYRMIPGEAKVFLPSDIHDTRCISESVTVLRFTSCDLKKEDREGRMIRFTGPEGMETRS